MGLVLDLLILYAFYALGFLIGWVLKSKRELSQKIGTKLLISIISPIQIIAVLIAAAFGLEISFIIQIVVIAVGFFSIHAISTLVILSKKKVDNKTKGSFFLLNSFPNVMFFTIPVVLAVFPEHDNLTIVSVIYTTVALVIRSSLGSVICQKLGSVEGKKVTVWSLLKVVFSFPPLIGIILGLILRTINIVVITNFFILIKPVVNEIASGLSSILVGMILAGISRNRLKEYAKNIKIGVLWRFGLSFVMFMLVVFFTRFSSLQTEIRTILLIIVTAPPAVFNVIFATYFKLDEKFAAISVASMTLMSLILLPLFIILGNAIF